MMYWLLGISGESELVVTPKELGIRVILYGWSHKLVGDA
jgi:hypothetical protein